MTRGGPRANSGRKPGHIKPASERKDQMMTLCCTDAERDKARRIGKGNISAGLRLALASYPEPTS